MMAYPRFRAIKGIRPHEWILRFLFGGAVCVLAGLVAKKFGAGIGGLFLAFPAIFPASATLVEAHERRHKARSGFDGTRRGRTVASIDAAGTALGCIGLAGFAIVCWLLLPRMSTAAVFALAILAWCVLSVATWLLRKSRLLRGRKRRRRAEQAFRAS
ncbi:MAG TPA: DUF3147 family protein [Terracidiphilus sp.]|jgi:hypothetical protein|nr:DUF3147 family protein [Terracidiphilus sp.]